MARKAKPRSNGRGSPRPSRKAVATHEGIRRQRARAKSPVRKILRKSAVFRRYEQVERLLSPRKTPPAGFPGRRTPVPSYPELLLRRPLQAAAKLLRRKAYTTLAPRPVRIVARLLRGQRAAKPVITPYLMSNNSGDTKKFHQLKTIPEPKPRTVCYSRKERREVLFAKNGLNGRARKSYNLDSQVTCK